MAEVHLRPITAANLDDCLALDVAEAQRGWVAPVVRSLAEAYAIPALVPLAVYDAAARGHEQPPEPPVGFTMYEVSEGVGFIMRLLIDQRHQRRGYGRATMLEVIRRLRLHPAVELIGTSYRRDNTPAAALYRDLGFVPWDIHYAQKYPDEPFLRLG
jgi:diamine N-acetyltransferase